MVVGSKTCENTVKGSRAYIYRAMQNPLLDVLNLSRSSQRHWEIYAVRAVESGCFLFKFSQLFMITYCAPDFFNLFKQHKKKQ